MPSNSGSLEPQPDDSEALKRLKEAVKRENERLAQDPVFQAARAAANSGSPGSLEPQPDTEMYALSQDERDRIADGEPYCFHCGRPASSFPEYEQYGQERFDAKDYVLHEEGTYNPDTNRFACDECYIAIGMPAGPDGWRAP